MILRDKIGFLIVAIFALLLVIVGTMVGCSLSSKAIRPNTQKNIKTRDPKESVSAFMSARMKRDEKGQIEELSEKARAKYQADPKMYTANMSNPHVGSYKIEGIKETGKTAEVSVTELWTYTSDPKYHRSQKPIFKLEELSGRWLIVNWTWK